MEYEGDGDTNGNWCAWNDPQRLDKVAGRAGKRRTSKDHENYYIRDRPEYREESWRTEETFCRLNSNEMLSADAGVKN